MDIKMESLNINCETGEETRIPLTKEQLAEFAKLAEDAAKEEAKRQQDVIDKAALLARLGITADEAKLLLT
jgi:hypothetical protein